MTTINNSLSALLPHVPENLETDYEPEKFFSPRKKFALLTTAQEPSLALIQQRGEDTVKRLEALSPIGTSAHDLYLYANQAQTLNLRTSPQQSATYSRASDQLKLKLSTPITDFEGNPLFVMPLESEGGGSPLADFAGVVYEFAKEGVQEVYEEISGNVERIKKEAFNPNNPKSFFYVKKNEPSLKIHTTSDRN